MKASQFFWKSKPAATAAFTATALIITALGLGAASLAATQAISVDHFEGWEEWPLLRPGDLNLQNSDLSQLRIEYEGLFREDPVTMYMDVFDVFHDGQPAVVVQWTSTSPEGADRGAPALDMIVVDRETFGTRFRIARSGPVDQGSGPYHLMHFGEDSVTQVRVGDDGESQTERIETGGPAFDFATFQFLFPFMELAEGNHMRLRQYGYAARTINDLPVRVAARTTVAGTNGEEHDAWPVEVLSVTGGVLITFYVRETAPYFMGWHYQRVADGETLVKMTYRGWLSTKISADAAR